MHARYIVCKAHLSWGRGRRPPLIISVNIADLRLNYQYYGTYSIADHDYTTLVFKISPSSYKLLYVVMTFYILGELFMHENATCH